MTAKIYNALWWRKDTLFSVFHRGSGIAKIPNQCMDATTKPGKEKKISGSAEAAMALPTWRRHISKDFSRSKKTGRDGKKIDE
jgi:hypothetical protein